MYFTIANPLSPLSVLRHLSHRLPLRPSTPSQKLVCACDAVITLRVCNVNCAMLHAIVQFN